eukprot:11821032-Alexandrium_andersonii.AAC.1
MAALAPHAFCPVEARCTVWLNRRLPGRRRGRCGQAAVGAQATSPRNPTGWQLRLHGISEVGPGSGASMDDQ